MDNYPDTGGERVQSNRYRVHLPDERVMEFELWRADRPALLTAISHPAGRVQLYYDQQTGLLTSLVDGLGRTVRVDWVFLSDPFGGPPRPQMSTFTLLGASPGGPSETLLTYHYDVNGHLTGGTDRYRNSFAFEYDAHGRMSKLVDRRGYSFNYAYDSRGRCTYSAAEDGVEEVRLQYLDGATIVVLADGGQWLYEHHAGFLARVVDPYGGEHSREVDDEGRLYAETDAGGRRFEVVRDDTGKAIGRRDSVGELWPMDEPPGEPEHYVASCSREWEFGTLLPSDHGLPIRRELEIAGFPAFIIDALTPPSTGDVNADLAERWRETTVWDVQGLRLRVERLDGSRRSWSYDASSNRTRYTDFDGSTWRWSFVSWNRAHEITDPLGNVTVLTHSPRLLLWSVMDPSGLVTEYGYDLKNRRTGVKRDGILRETYAYDASDELVEKGDGHGQWLLRFERKDEGRHVKLQMASGECHELFYTSRRNIASAIITGADGRKDKYSFAYDFFGRETRDLQNGIGVRRRFDMRHLAETSVLSKYVTRYHRSRRHALEIVDPTGAKHSVQTSPGGVVRRQMSNGVTEVSQYHPEGYCLAKIAYTASEYRWFRWYECSGEGDVRAIHDSVQGAHRFTYDAAHRLIGEVLPGGQTHTFEYSPGGTLVAGSGLRGVTTSHQRVYDANGSRIEYDERQRVCARRTARGTFRFAYDSRDQLIAISGPSFAWSARYDVLGRRIETAFNGATSKFYWDGDRLAAEIRPDGQLRVYVYADHLALVPLMFVDYANIDADPSSGKRYFVFGNHLGAPEVIQDDAGQVVWRARYEAYGTAYVSIGADFHQPLRWPGHYFDAATGLHCVRFRYYSPEIGQFLQPDPQGVNGGFNLHAYAAGNPLRYVDVRGLNGCPTPTDPNEKKTTKGKDDTEGAEPKSPDGKPKRPPQWEEGEVGKPPSSQQQRDKLRAARAAQERSEELASALKGKNKGKCVAVNGEPKMSGHKSKLPEGYNREGTDAKSMLNHQDEIGHPARPQGAMDGDTPGAAASTHAEKQVAVAQMKNGTNEPIGVSKDQCGDCREMMRDHAMDERQKEPVIVADPNHTRVYDSDGSVKVYDKDDNLVRSVPPDEPASARLTGNYENNPW